MLAAERSFELFELSDTQIIPLQYISMTCGSAVLQVVLLLTYNSRVMATPLDADRPDFETMTAKDLTQWLKEQGIPEKYYSIFQGELHRPFLGGGGFDHHF